MRILYVRHDVAGHPNPATLTDLVFVKALGRLGHQVQQFDFRTRCAKIGPQEMNLELIVEERFIQPDLIIFGKCESVLPDTIKQIKKDLPNSKIVLWYGDQRQAVVDLIVEQAKYCDLFLHTTGGQRLREYREATKMPSGFIPFAVDHSICCPGTLDQAFVSDRPIFCGGEHTPGDKFDFYHLRYETLNDLKKADVCKFYGCFGYKGVMGDAYIAAMRGAPAVISISGYANLDKYISDRPIHILACGTLLIQHQTPKIETLLKPDEYIPFETAEEAVNIAQNVMNKRLEPKLIASKRVAGLMASYRFTGEEILGEVFKMLRGSDHGKYPWYEFYR